MSATNVRSTENKRVLMMNERGNMMLPILGIFLVIGIMLQSSELVRIAQSNSITANTRIRDSRNALTLFLSRYSALPAAYRNSIVKSDNADLQSCVFGSAASLCYADGREYPMNLYAPSVDGAPAKLLASAAVGTQSQPVLYNNKGQLCETGAKSATVACPFEVTSSFKATCAGGATSCAKAESIFIQYKIHTPESLYSDASVKNRLVLATVENTAASVAVKNILPPSYDYVPNSVTVVSFVTNTTTTTVAGVTYEQAYAAILATIGGSDATLAKTITDMLYTYFGITSLDTLTGLATVWMQNPTIAKRMADSIHYRMQYWKGYTSPTAAQIALVAQVPLTMTNQMLAKALVSGMFADPVLNQAIANAIVGLTSYDVAQVVVANKVTDPALALAMQAAIQTSGMSFTYSIPYAFGEEIVDANIKDAALMLTYANLIVASGAGEDAARQIVRQGVTSLTVAKQLVATYGGTPTSTTTASTTTPKTTTTTVSTTTSTTTTTASTVPVTLTAACTNATDCGTTIGM